MIKCKHCGSPLGMDQAFCTYCGKPNDYFKKHRQDMAYYEQEFRQTQNDVYNRTNRYANLTVSIIIICVLIALNIATVFVTSKSWDISYFLRQKNVFSNTEKHEQVLEKYESEQNYFGLSKYYYDNNVYYIDDLEEYSVVIRFCEEYFRFYENLMQTQIGQFNEDAFNNSVEFMADSICNMQEMLDREDYYIEEAYSDVHVQSMQNMYELTKDMLRSYVGFSEEQLDNLGTYSKAKIMIMLEEGVPYVEKK